MSLEQWRDLGTEGWTKWSRWMGFTTVIKIHALDATVSTFITSQFSYYEQNLFRVRHTRRRKENKPNQVQVPMHQPSIWQSRPCDGLWWVIFFFFLTKWFWWSMSYFQTAAKFLTWKQTVKTLCLNLVSSYLLLINQPKKQNHVEIPCKSRPKCTNFIQPKSPQPRLLNT